MRTIYAYYCSFGYLRIYIILKPFQVVIPACRSFGHLRIYVILKHNCYVRASVHVLELYEITPFSNCDAVTWKDLIALELYEITPFSNRISHRRYYQEFLTSTIHHSQTCYIPPKSFQLFWTSTNLHHSQTFLVYIYIFCRFWISTNLHHSQTGSRHSGRTLLFWISTNLHHSQTLMLTAQLLLCFGYLRIYIILKPENTAKQLL